MLLIEHCQLNHFRHKEGVMKGFKSIILIVIAGLFQFTGATPQTQSQMNQNTCKQYERADAELNNVYKQVLSEYAKDTEFIGKFREAQRAWVAFRDAHLESLYPAKDKLAEYGSVYETCRCLVLTDLTKQRTEMLRQWLKGVKEGDVCSGSIKIRG